jgi:hypothetical protein
MDGSPQYRQTLLLGGGADFVTMPLDDVPGLPPDSEVASEITEDTNRPALWRAVPFGAPQPFAARRTGGRLDSMLLSQDASPVEQTHEEEHDRDHQEHMDERANGVDPDEPQ